MNQDLAAVWESCLGKPGFSHKGRPGETGGLERLERLERAAEINRD